MPIDTQLLLKSIIANRRVIIPLLLILVLGLTSGYERYYRNYLERDWQTISLDEKQKTATEIRSKFKSYCDITIRAVEHLTTSILLSDQLKNYSDKSRVKLFEYLSEQSKDDLTFEIYDKSKILVSWIGNRHGEIDTSKLESGRTLFLREGAIYSYLVLSIPITQKDTVIGYLVGKRLFDFNYPLNNRFINSNTFETTFSRYINSGSDIIFSADSSNRNNNSLQVIPLFGFSNKPILFAFVPIQTLSVCADELHEKIIFINSLIGLILIIFLLEIIRRTFIQNGIILRILVLTIYIWIFRYVLVWLNIPLAIFKFKLFEPMYFASPFGWGIAKSLGDLFLSSIFLFINLILVVQAIKDTTDKGKTALFEKYKSSKLVAFFVVVCCEIILLLIVRGYAATIRSAIFDSILVFNDPTSVLPSFEHMIMLMSLFLISCSVLIGSVGLIIFMKRSVRLFLSSEAKQTITWFIVIIILLIGSFVFGLTQSNTLLSQSARIYVFLILTSAAIWFSWYWSKNISHYIIYLLFFFCFTTVIILVPQLDDRVNELERTRVELLATEIIRPENSWLELLLNKALDELSNNNVVQIFSEGDKYDVTKLAFNQWAISILSKEGNNCSIVYFDRSGNILSTFHIGILPVNKDDSFEEVIPFQRSVYKEDRMQNGASVKCYVGYTPIKGKQESIIGGVRIELSGSRQTMIRGEASEILRSYSKEQNTRYPRLITYSEYFGGKLLNTTSHDIPRDREIPNSVYIEEPGMIGVWINDIIEGKSFETYYFQNPESQSTESWFALGMETFEWRWYVYSYLRYFFLYLTISFFLTAIIMIIRMIIGKKYIFSFQARIITAFIVLSILPVLLLAYYNRGYAVESTTRSTDKLLREQTSAVLAEVQKTLNITTPAALARLADERCMDIANYLNNDFNIYFLSNIQASSKPEMFESELIDSSLTANAYLNIILKHKEYFSGQQNIGNLSYIVGYRPLIADDGTIIGAVAVPTLYRQAEIDDALAERNIYLYGAYAVSLVLSILIGTFIAKRISSPIYRLKNATHRIASGELDVELHHDRKDELGDLERAFLQMTKELRAAQEKMITAQREAAWKEMAKQVAHEIKNPLTPMKLSIQHLRQAYKDSVKNFNEIFHQITSTILEQIDVLSNIAGEFSNYARMPQRSEKYMDVHLVLDEARNLFQQYENIKFDTLYEATSSKVVGDHEELRRAFINILRNAIQAIATSGRIIIKTNSTNRFITINVVDNGPGIPIEIRNRIFEPSFSTKTDGMGLGLALVKKTIDEHDGTISIFSELGAGTTVTIKLPLSTDKEI